MEEIWKDITGYEGLYQISNMGRVKRLPSVIHLKTGGVKNYRGGVLTPNRGRSAWKYESVSLSKNGEVHAFSIHRLVAMMFVPNPDGKPEVNHIDENIYNNRFDNLEWVSHRENIMSGTVQERIDKGRNKCKKKVYQYDKKGNLIKTYDGCVDVEKDGFSSKCVATCCVGKQKTHKGFVWSHERYQGEAVS